MKTKLFLIFLAVFLPLSAFVLNADEKKDEQQIPLNQKNEDPLIHNRSLTQLPIECHYFGPMNSIVTTVFSDLGNVVLTVTNCSTGNIWSDSFDSAMEPQTILNLTGESGFYLITYTTESGDIYEGILNLN